MARTASRVASTLSCQTAFLKRNSEEKNEESQTTSVLKKKEIWLDDSYSKPYEILQDLSFVLQSPQEATRKMNLYEPYMEKKPEINLFWENWHIDLENDFLNNRQWYTTPILDAEIEENRWYYYSVPFSGSLWLLFIGAVLFSSRRR